MLNPDLNWWFVSRKKVFVQNEARVPSRQNKTVALHAWLHSSVCALYLRKNMYACIYACTCVHTSLCMRVWVQVSDIIISLWFSLARVWEWSKYANVSFRRDSKSALAYRDDYILLQLWFLMNDIVDISWKISFFFHFIFRVLYISLANENETDFAFKKTDLQ